MNSRGPPFSSVVRHFGGLGDEKKSDESRLNRPDVIEGMSKYDLWPIVGRRWMRGEPFAGEHEG